jgi:hypothetical protein
MENNVVFTNGEMEEMAVFLSTLKYHGFNFYCEVRRPSGDRTEYLIRIL